MLEPGMKSSEGRSALGIILAGGFCIYYILSSRNPSLPSVDHLLANADDAVSIAKAYATNINIPSTSDNIFDGGTVMALLFGIYKTYSKYTGGRVTLKIEDGKIKLKESILVANINKINPNTVNTPIVTDTSVVNNIPIITDDTSLNKF